MGSYGQTLMRRYLELMLDADAMEDIRPVWLEGLELDLFWPQIGFAVEFQGDQHFVPAYGIHALLTQRENDAKKQQLCDRRGVVLLKLSAIDLEYTTLYRKLSKAMKGFRGFRKFITRKNIRGLLRCLNKEATAYRQTLVEKFNSPTARRKGAKRREARKAAWAKVPVWQIIQARKRLNPKKPFHALPAIGKGMARAKLIAPVTPPSPVITI